MFTPTLRNILESLERHLTTPFYKYLDVMGTPLMSLVLYPIERNSWSKRQNLHSVAGMNQQAWRTWKERETMARRRKDGREGGASFQRGKGQ